MVRTEMISDMITGFEGAVYVPEQVLGQS